MEIWINSIVFVFGVLLGFLFKTRIALNVKIENHGPEPDISRKVVQNSGENASGH